MCHFAECLVLLNVWNFTECHETECCGTLSIGRIISEDEFKLSFYRLDHRIVLHQRERERETERERERERQRKRNWMQGGGMACTKNSELSVIFAILQTPLNLVKLLGSPHCLREKDLGDLSTLKIITYVILY